MSNNRTTDEIFAPTEQARVAEPATRFVDIHIYDYEPEPEEPACLESDQEPEQETLPPESTQEPTEPGRPHHRKRSLLAACMGIACLLVLGAFVMVDVLALFTPDATITIVTSTQPIRTTQTIMVTTGQATGTQLQGRALAAITMNQVRTVPTTGKGHQDARAAQGDITFYNAATSPQIVAAGTLLTGANGIQVITEQDALIPAASYPIFGQRTILAQSVIPGPGGNIRAGEIYGPCCRLNVSAVSSAFTGGQQARDYQTVTMQDITTVAASMKTSLNQSMQAAFQTQVHPDETLITSLPCQRNVKPDHQPGEEAAQVTILVSETCIGMTYHTQAFHTLVTQIITQQAHNQLGDGYTMQGAVQASINNVSQKGLAATLQTPIAAMWGYRFTQQQQAQIKAKINGKSKAQAITSLLHIPGVQSVSIGSESIPNNVNRIHLVFLVMQ